MKYVYRLIGSIQGVYIFLAVLLIGGTAGATPTTLTSGMLPYTTTKTAETLYVSGTKIQSATSGIIIRHNNVLIDGDPDGDKNLDTLQWSTSNGSNHIAISDDGFSTAAGLQVRNIVLLNYSPDVAGVPVDTNCEGIWNRYGDNTLYDSVVIIQVGGRDCNAIVIGTGANYYNVHTRKCQIYDTTTEYSSRDDMTGAAVWQVQTSGIPTSQAGFNYHVRHDSTIIWSCPSQGFVLRQAAATYGCKVVGRLRNNITTEEGNCFGYLMRGIVPTINPIIGTSERFTGIRKCTVLVSTTGKGYRGIHVTGNAGTATNWTYCDSNYVDISLGPNGESQAAYTFEPEADASTSSNKYLYAKHNSFINHCDDNPATAYIGNEARSIQVIPTNADTNVFIDSNFIMTVASGTITNAATVNFQFVQSTAPAPSPTEWDSTYTFRYNTVWSGVAMTSNVRSLVEGNTFRRLPVDSCATSPTGVLGAVDYQPTGTDTGAWFVDGTYQNMDDTAIHHSNASSGVNNSYIARRATITVRDNASNIVPGANVVVKDKNGLTWFTGTTDANGQVRALSPYFKKSQNGATITAEVLNPYKILANNGGADDSTAVSWSTSVGTATVTLAGGGGVTPTTPITGGVTVQGGVIIK